MVKKSSTKGGSRKAASMPELQRTTKESPLSQAVDSLKQSSLRARSSSSLNLPKIKPVREGSSNTGLGSASPGTRILESLFQLLQDVSPTTPESNGAGSGGQPVSGAVDTPSLRKRTPPSVIPPPFSPVGGLVANAPFSRKSSETSISVSESSARSSVTKFSLPSSASDLDITPFGSKSPQISSENRRRIVKYCLDLKRLLDKEGGYVFSDSTLQRSLFSTKSSVNVSILFKCLKVLVDIDVAIIITNILVRLTQHTESSSSNMSFMAKRGLCIALLQTLRVAQAEIVKLQQMQHQINSSSTSGGSALPSNSGSRADELATNIFTLLIKLSRYDTKFPLLARVHCSVEIIIEFVQRFQEKKDISASLMSFHILKLLSAKNENNALSMHKRGLVEMTSSMLKTLTTQNKDTYKLDCLIDLLTIFAKIKGVLSEILKSLSVRYFIGLFALSGSESMHKSLLRFLKIVVDNDEGRRMFVNADGFGVLMSYLESIIKESEQSAGSAYSNIIPQLIVTVIRAAVPTCELPFLSEHVRYEFPLPLSSDAEVEAEAKLEPFELQEEEERVLMYLSPEFEMTGGQAPEVVSDDSCSPAVHFAQPHATSDQSCGHNSTEEAEPFFRKSNNTSRRLIWEQTSRLLQPGLSQNILVYDVMNDSVGKAARAMEGTLIFESRFESGNLQMAIKVSETEYDLMLQSDINAGFGKHNQWFYFSIEGMMSNVSYKFNIINMSKANSQFNSGMQPVIYSKIDDCWRRIGDNVLYLRNHYRKCPGEKNPNAWISYSSAIFVIQVKNDNDVYSLAYHYPYTYTDYQKFMSRVSLLPNFDLKCRRQLLCKTLSHNNCDLLTITAFDPESLGASPLDERKYIFLSSRVHPGETNSSFIIEGVIAFLLSDEATAIKLRSTCIFKIIPMLNPDGVINGSHRCSLAGVDLNRQWQAPMLKHHPTIYWAKKVLSHLVAKGKRPLLSCDFHGHSKRKNMFLFGCETLAPNDGLEKIFPQLMSDRSSLFDLSQCKYAIEKSKEATARVVIWRELGVVASYTLESTYCGIDIGPLKGLQIKPNDLFQVGQSFAKAVMVMVEIFGPNVPCNAVAGQDGPRQSSSGGGLRGNESSDEEGGEYGQDDADEL